jgi:hypothetical protein
MPIQTTAGNPRVLISPHSALDDGDPPTHWTDTAIQQEFSRVSSAFFRWAGENKTDYPSEEFKAMVRVASTVMEEIGLMMTGEL